MFPQGELAREQVEKGIGSYMAHLARSGALDNDPDLLDDITSFCVGLEDEQDDEP